MEMAYVNLPEGPVLIEKIHSLESRYFFPFYHAGCHGEIPIEIENRYLRKALQFIEKRAKFHKEYSSLGYFDFDQLFDLKFLQDVRQSGLNLPALIHAAGTLGIDQLFRLLLNDVVDIFCKDDDSKSVQEFFEVLYKNEDHRYCDYYNRILDLAFPCPTLSKDEQEEMNYNPGNRQRILNTSPDELKNLDDKEKLYWVYAHLVIKRSIAPSFVEKSFVEDEEEDDEDDEEEDEEEDDEDEEDEEDEEEDDEDEEDKEEDEEKYL